MYITAELSCIANTASASYLCYNWDAMYGTALLWHVVCIWLGTAACFLVAGVAENKDVLSVESWSQFQGAHVLVPLLMFPIYCSINVNCCRPNKNSSLAATKVLHLMNNRELLVPRV